MSDVQVSFAAPPVVEVVAGVAIDGLSMEAAPLLSAFWANHLRGNYPKLEQQPPYLPPVEEFPSPVSRLSFQMDFGPPAQRLWATTSDGQELLQLQPGWFACNWRKVQPNDDYDRWPGRRAAFELWFSRLTAFLIEEGIGAPKITQCEVSYINHVRPVAGIWTEHRQFERVFKAQLSPEMPLALEQVSAHAQFLLERDGVTRGRLHVKVLPAFDRDGTTPLYVLELTARGHPDDNGLAGALAFLDEGRSAINAAFIALTTEEMQKAWGRER